MRKGWSLDDSDRTILAEADRFARDRLAPLAARMDDEEWWPDKEFRSIGASGYFGVTAPVELGGADSDLFASGLVLQAFARWNHALALSWVAHENLCLNNILRNATDSQSRAYLPGLCSGSLIGCLALTEPDAGSDALGSMKTTATRDGEYYRIKGSKLFITNGPVADLALLYAKTDPARGSHGVSAFVIDLHAPGVTISRHLRKMGFRGSPTGELVFDDYRVPVAARIGSENEGLACVMGGLDLERAMISAICVGIAERALELSLEYARTRKQFGQPIGQFQMIQARLAEMYTLVETMKVYNYHCLSMLTDLPVGEGGRGDVHKISASSVLYCAESLNSLLSHASQIHGGISYIWETEINRLFRAIKLLEIGAGTTEIRKLIIAQEMMK